MDKTANSTDKVSEFGQDVLKDLLEIMHGASLISREPSSSESSQDKDNNAHSMEEDLTN
jgi:hypothetical protein